MSKTRDAASAIYATALIIMGVATGALFGLATYLAVKEAKATTEMARNVTEAAWKAQTEADRKLKELSATHLQEAQAQRAVVEGLRAELAAKAKPACPALPGRPNHDQSL